MRRRARHHRTGLVAPRHGSDHRHAGRPARRQEHDLLSTHHGKIARRMRDTVSGSIFAGRDAPRRLLGLFSLTVLFCIPVAAVLTVTGATGVTFGRNLLFSECIGLSVFLVSTLIRYLPGVRDLPLRTAILVSLLVA